MQKKMTSGEIAKKTGVSQKAIRIYDEKGLLKPTEYSEGNYRLYDEKALLILEKIIALKQVGFTLEEIRDRLKHDQEMDVTQVLKQQIQILEQKKYQLEKSIDCVKRALERSEKEPDWDSISEIMRTIQMDQGADDRHFYALSHTVDNKDWYCKIFDMLQIQEKEKILDLGCGFSKLWRNNWDDIPEHTKIFAYDLHGSWADDFSNFVKENKHTLSKDSSIEMMWGDVEEEKTWKEIADEAPYDRIIAHYLFQFLKDKEVLIQRASEQLRTGGVFCCNGAGVSEVFTFWKQIFEDCGMDISFAEKRIDHFEQKTEGLQDLLLKYFNRVEKVHIINSMKYDKAEDLYEQALRRFPDDVKKIKDNKDKLIAGIQKKIESENEIIVQSSTLFWHCYK